MMKQSTKHILNDLIVRYPALDCCKEGIFSAVAVSARAYAEGGKVLACGNGGSAADSMHIVGELMKGFTLPRKLPEALCQQIAQTSPETAAYLTENLQQALPAISLVGETALSTAYSNDISPVLCFAQQVLAHGKAGDILLGISTSGNSANVIYAAQMARVKGMQVIALTGGTGGGLVDWADVPIIVPASVTYHIQELHLPVYHAYCLALENEFFGG